ncbi:retention module-containing protein, partial [Amphritea balenae]
MENVESTKGLVVQITGEVVVVDAQGIERNLTAGDKLQAGDMIITRAESSAELNLGKEQPESVPADTAAVLEVDPTTGEITLVIHSLGTEGIEIADIQQAILEGQDPTELLEETAAGNTPPTRSGFSDFQDVNRTAEEVIAEAGFDTSIEDRELEEFPEYEGEFVAQSDDGVIVSVTSVTSDTQGEGSNLTHTVTLSGASVNDETYSFSLTDNTTEPADYSGLSFSDGVTYDAGTGLITVPATVTSFDITVDAVPDADIEGSETYDLAVGDQLATGTITDASTITVTGVSSDAQSEGSTLTHTVTLSGSSVNDETYTLAIFDITTNAFDWNNLQFTDGVIYDAGTGLITVPATVTSFDITVDANDDSASESDEYYELQVDGVVATGTVIDNDGVATIEVLGGDVVTEDDASYAKFTVQLSNPAGSNVDANLAL